MSVAMSFHLLVETRDFDELHGVVAQLSAISSSTASRSGDDGLATPATPASPSTTNSATA